MNEKVKKIICAISAIIILFSAIIITPIDSNASTTAIKTRDEAVAWLKSQEGKNYDFDSAKGTQCTEFVKAYVNWLVKGDPWKDTWYLNGIGGRTYDGRNIWDNPLWEKLDWIVYENTSDFVPQPGDIFSAGISKANHTGVVISSTVKTATVVHANMDGTPDSGGPARIESIDWRAASADHYVGATKFIRPRFANTSQPSQPSYTYTNISGEYYLKNENNGQYLTVDGFTDADKANISTAAKSSEKQKVTITNVGGNNHKIVPACTSRLVNAWGNNPTSGANVNLYHLDSSNSSSQLWKFEKVRENMYRIHLAYNEELCLAISGTNVTVQNITDYSPQRWILEPVHNEHDYNTLAYFGKSHPHYNYYKCSCGDVRTEITETNSYDSCAICKGRIKYNANGGELNFDAVATANINGINIPRSAEYVVVYTRDFGSKTTTNIYGEEYAFDANGAHIATRNYGEEENLAIPSGGFVLSVISGANIKLIRDYMSNAKYAYYDTNEKIIYFYKTKEDYAAGTKFLTNGNAYGELPVPTREGYIFDGWYTQASGGEKITSTTTFNGITQLYAQWTNRNDEDFNYTIENDEVTITKYTGTDTEVIIPATIEGKPVTRIEDKAFSVCDELTSITIPDSITSIGWYAFSSCRKLENITINKNIISIGYGAFHCCNSLTMINVDSDNANYSSEDGVLFNKDKTTLIKYPGNKEDITYSIPNNVTIIENNAFEWCNNLTNVTIPEGVTNIGTETFQWCEKLENIVLPESLLIIGSRAFTDCRSLTNITIPENVTNIGYCAFGYCSGLESIFIPKKVETIEPRAFYYAHSLKNINVSDENEYYRSENGILFSKDKTKLVAYPFAKEDSTYKIPDSVKDIESYAFAGSEVVIDELPSNLINIGEKAFNNCDNIKNINIPSSVQTIGIGAFSTCFELTSIEVDNNNQNYSSENGVLFNKEKTKLLAYPIRKSDTSYTIPNSVTSIEEEAFNNSWYLKNLIVSENVVNVSYFAFSGRYSDLTIHGYKGSYIEQYANKERYKF